jgi:hypothetical protein
VVHTFELLVSLAALGVVVMLCNEKGFLVVVLLVRGVLYVCNFTSLLGVQVAANTILLISGSSL